MAKPGDNTKLKTKNRANINIPKLIEFHRGQKGLMTLTAVRPPACFGQMILDDGKVTEFKENPQIGEGWINGGFFVLQPEVVDHIDGDQTAWKFELAGKDLGGRSISRLSAKSM